MIIFIFEWIISLSFIVFLVGFLHFFSSEDMRQMLTIEINSFVNYGIINRLIERGLSRTFDWFREIDWFFNFLAGWRIGNGHISFFAWTSSKTKQYSIFSLSLSLSLCLPMFIQRDMTLKGLSTISTINECFSISMRTFMSTEIGELCVRFRTELNQMKWFFLWEYTISYFTFPWFNTRMNISMLFQTGWCLKTFATIFTCIQTIFTFTCFTWIRRILMIIYRLVHSKREISIFFIERKLSSMTTYILSN